MSIIAQSSTLKLYELQVLIVSLKKTFFYQTEWFYVPSISKSVSQSSSSSLRSTFWKKSSSSGDNEPEESLRRMPVGGLNAAYNATQNVIQISNKCCRLQNVALLWILERALTLRKPKGELAPLARHKIAESLSEGDRIGVEILSDPTSII